MNVMGIVFTNDASLGALTDQRTMGSLPYGGRYRLIDFALSNLCSAGIRRVGVISRHSYQSLMNHIGDGEEWGLELEQGGLEYLTPYATSLKDSYRGKLESLHTAMGSLKHGSEDELVVLTDSAIVSNIDLKDVIRSHIRSGRDITVVTKAGIADGNKLIDLAIKLDDKGDVADVVVDYAATSDYVASMDIFVVNKKFLLDKVRAYIAHNLYHMDRDLVMGGWQRGEVTLNVYQFPGVVHFNETVEEYFTNSLALIRAKVRHDIFGYNHPVYTKVRDRVPSYYGENAQIDNCIVADGCRLEGKAVNTILFRQVTVAEGANVENCVIMNDAVIGAGATLKNVILDKDVTVQPGAVLIGTLKNPIIVERGETV